MTDETRQPTDDSGRPIDRFLGVRAAHSPSLGPDGTKLAFLLDTTGTPEVWTQDGPGTWPTQRTVFDHSVTFVSWSPVEPEFVCGVDPDGRGNTQLFRVAVPTGRTERLTDSSDATHRWGGWNHAGDRFAFAADRDRDDGFDVYLGTRDGDETRLTTGDGWLSPRDWSATDDRLLLVATTGDGERLFEYDLQASERRPLTLAEGVSFTSPQWGPTQESIYVVTDYDNDSHYLARLDAAAARTGVEDLDTLLTTVDDPGRYDVSGLVAHAPTGRLVWARDVDGYSSLVVGRVDETGTVTETAVPDLPDGVTSSLAFAADGSRFAVAVSSRRRSSDVYVVTLDDPAAPTTVRWTDSSMGGLPASRFATASVNRVESFDGLSVPVFYTPPPVADGEAVPAVIDVHGGPDTQRRPSFYPLAQYLRDHGYAYCEPNIRGSTGYGTEYESLDDGRNRLDAVRDVRAVARWLANRDEVDENRIVLLGSSYGGFVTLSCLTRYPDQWAAGVAVNGIYDLVAFLDGTAAYRRSVREAEYGSLTDDRAFLERISPVSDASAVTAPLLVVHGRADERVPVEQAERLAAAVADSGPPVETLFVDDMGHTVRETRYRRQVYTAVADFLDRHVDSPNFTDFSV